MITDTYKGYTIKVNHVMDKTDPLSQKGKLGKFILFHDQFELGHAHGFDKPESAYYFLKALKTVYMPVYLTQIDGEIHLTTTVSAAKAKESQIGWIYTDRDKALQVAESTYKVGHAVKRELLETLRKEVEAYDAYLHSEIYSYVIEDKEKPVDRAAGYLSESEALQHAHAKIDSYNAPEVIKHPRFSFPNLRKHREKEKELN